jgi:1-acyl-sn-glycerol-3-phosphate acyltransferase
MDVSLYNTVRIVGAPFRYRVIGLDNIIDGGPAIYVANHLSSIGPIQVILSVPLRFYPWVSAEMTDMQRAPGYLYDDFIYPSWHLQGRFGMVVSRLVSRVAVTLINGLGCISVDRSSGWTGAAFRRSLDLLLAGQNLLVFPEDSLLDVNPETDMYPFMCGFLALCRMYRDNTGKQLSVYPMAVQPAKRIITINEAVYFQDLGRRRQDIRIFCGQLQETVSNMYLSCN